MVVAVVVRAVVAAAQVSRVAQAHKASSSLRTQ
jgi:hypothetical protein